MTAARPSSSPNIPNEIIITIDGPAGTGKSSVARQLAIRLGLDLLDTGAMYRAAAAIVLDSRIDQDDEAAIIDAVAAEDLHFDFAVDPPELLASGRPMSRRIREPDVTACVSKFAAIPELRKHMVRKQRIIAQQHPRLVSEGRDQGSVVFPDACVKFFLDAAPEIRAMRRANQLRKAGIEVREEQLLAEIQSRDKADSGRAVGPLVQPPDSTIVDTTNLSFSGVVDRLETLVHEVLADPQHSVPTVHTPKAMADPTRCANPA